MFILAIITIFWIRIAKSKVTFAQKVQYYAVVKNLNDAVNGLKSNGYTDSGVTTYNFPTDGTKFCNYLANIFNTVGEVKCTSASNITSGTTDFKDKTPSFALSNGAVVYNAANNITNLPSTSAFIAQNTNIMNSLNFALDEFKKNILYSNAVFADTTCADP